MGLQTRIRVGPFIWTGSPSREHYTGAKEMPRWSKILLAAVSLLFIGLPLIGALLHWLLT
jgi:hypothetical protein